MRSKSCRTIHAPAVFTHCALRRTNPSPYLDPLRLRKIRRSRDRVPKNLSGIGRRRHNSPDCRHPSGGATPHEDKMLEEELLADPKSAPSTMRSMAATMSAGSPDRHRQSDGQFLIERYSHVMHIVSNVEGEAADKLDAVLPWRPACFPAGTVVRRAEGPRHGNHRRARKGKTRPLCGLRRLFFRRRRDGHLHRAAHRAGQGRQDDVQAGAGIVADWNPQSEQQECINKAKALVSGCGRGPPFASTAKRGDNDRRSPLLDLLQPHRKPLQARWNMIVLIDNYDNLFHYLGGLGRTLPCIATTRSRLLT